MAAHSDLYPLILPDVPGCPEPTVDTAINRAAMEFCRDSRAWEEVTDPIVLVAGVQSYLIDLPACSQLVAVRRATINDRPLVPVNDGRSVLLLGDASGEPSRFGVTGSDMHLYPTPGADSAGLLVQTQLFLAPVLTATTLPCVLVTVYPDAIAEGAKALLKRMPGKPWLDPQGAVLCDRLFQQRKAAARIDSEYGRVVAGLSVTPRAFGG